MFYLLQGHYNVWGYPKPYTLNLYFPEVNRRNAPEMLEAERMKPYCFQGVIITATQTVPKHHGIMEKILGTTTMGLYSYMGIMEKQMETMQSLRAFPGSELQCRLPKIEI